jgi:hypothetical protein
MYRKCDVILDTKIDLLVIKIKLDFHFPYPIGTKVM